ncbi:MAG TPA: 4Fe-4S dicluster domain-containing protein, partial [Methylomirabilota bacterium]|nr:4Fe-4S dicluster domain-containing protein [Methylomirabilota bacterium]
KAKQVPPLRLKPPDPDGKYRMMQEDVDRPQEFHKCIECFLCQDVCHVIRDHEDKKARFSGPRFFIKAASLEMHPLDTVDRTEFLNQHAGLGLCNITKCCTEVCPEHIHITDNGIIPMKERVADGYDPIVWAMRKLGLSKKK